MNDCKSFDIAARPAIPVGKTHWAPGYEIRIHYKPQLFCEAGYSHRSFNSNYLLDVGVAEPSLPGVDEEKYNGL